MDSRPPRSVTLIRIATGVPRRVGRALIKGLLAAFGLKNLQLPVGDTYYGDTAHNYLQLRAQQQHWQLEQAAIEALAARFPEGTRVLDVPFGTGRFVPFYLAKGMVVYGLDASEDMLALARKSLGDKYYMCNVQMGDAIRLPYQDNFFDLVVCVRFLSHVVSFSVAKAVLGEIWRVTRSHALLQFRVRREDVPSTRPPRPFEAMGDRLSQDALVRLLNVYPFVVETIRPLERRNTYYRAVFLCSKTDAQQR